MPIVLASASPRRQELLKNAGVEFVVLPADIAEVRRKNETPRAFAERMAREKAHAVHARSTDKYVLAADTVVVVEDQVLGKPEDEKDAVRMLRLLSGRKHQVITGVCLLATEFEDVRSKSTAVHFSELTDADIHAYIATREPMDKAGAYAIQGLAVRWISKIEGDYSNVVGLPLNLVLQMLREHQVARL